MLRSASSSHSPECVLEDLYSFSAAIYFCEIRLKVLHRVSRLDGVREEFEVLLNCSYRLWMAFQNSSDLIFPELSETETQAGARA